MIVYTAEKDQIKYFVQNYLGKITFSYVQTATWLSSCCHKLRLFCEILQKTFSQLQSLEMHYIMNDRHIR